MSQPSRASKLPLQSERDSEQLGPPVGNLASALARTSQAATPFLSAALSSTDSELRSHVAECVLVDRYALALDEIIDEAKSQPPTAHEHARSVLAQRPIDSDPASADNAEAFKRKRRHLALNVAPPSAAVPASSSSSIALSPAAAVPSESTIAATPSAAISTPRGITSKTSNVPTKTLSMPSAPSASVAISAVPSVRYSSLTAQEHAEFLAILNKVISYTTLRSRAADLTGTLNANELVQWTALHQKVAQEQRAYCDWLRSDLEARIHLWERYTNYPEAARTYVDELLASRRSRVLSLPSRYVRRATIDFSNLHNNVELNEASHASSEDITLMQIPQNNAAPPTLRHATTLLKLGSVPFLNPAPVLSTQVVKLHQYKALPTVDNDPIVEWLLNPGSLVPSSAALASLQIPPPGPLPLALAGSAAHADVVLSSSVLSLLIDQHHPGFLSSWEIPCVVRSVQGKPDAARVFLSKPLPSKRMTARERTALYFKHLFRAACYSDVTRSKDLFSGQVVAVPPGAPLSGLPPHARNITYNVWRLGDLQLLVRCRIHGAVNQPPSAPLSAPENPQQVSSSSSSAPTAAPSPSSSASTLRFVAIQAKMQYLVQPGGVFPEVTTLSEKARWWAETYLRPDAHLLLGHVALDVPSAAPESQSNETPLPAKLVNMQTLNLSNIYSGAAYAPNDIVASFCSLDSFKFLYALLRCLKSLPEGNYLLSHDTGSPVVHILSAVPNANATASGSASLASASSSEASGGADSDSESDAEGDLEIADEPSAANTNKITSKPVPSAQSVSSSATLPTAPSASYQPTLDPTAASSFRSVSGNVIVYDLHSAYAAPPTEVPPQEAFVPPIYNLAQQIPYTFPLPPANASVPDGPRGMPPPNLSASLHCRVFSSKGYCDTPGCTNRHTRTRVVRYCHSFAEGEGCAKGSLCEFPHLTLPQVYERIQKVRSKDPKAKRKKPGKGEAPANPPKRKMKGSKKSDPPPATVEKTQAKKPKKKKSKTANKLTTKPTASLEDVVSAPLPRPAVMTETPFTEAPIDYGMG